MYWTDDRLREEALQFETRTSWSKLSNSSYSIAWRKGKEFYESCCAHMHTKGKHKKPFPETFAGKYPQLLVDWDYEKNPNPATISAHTHLVCHWRCHLCNASWQAPPHQRAHDYEQRVARGGEARSIGCRTCAIRLFGTARMVTSKRKRSIGLFEECPELLNEWDHEKNTVSPESVCRVSNQKYWWKCAKGHSWQANAQNRNLAKSRCPHCYPHFSEMEAYFLCELRAIGLRVLFQHRLPKKMELDLFLPDHQIGIEIDGTYWHQRDQAKERDLKKDQYCKEHAIRLFRVSNTAQECDYQNAFNQLVMELKLYCLDERLHNYPMTQLDRAAYLNMLVDFNRPPLERSLQHCFPEVASEWDDEANYPFTPRDVTKASDKKFHWKCPLNHRYEATIKNRTNRNSGCPHCYNNLRKGKAYGTINRNHIAAAYAVRRLGQSDGEGQEC